MTWTDEAGNLLKAAPPQAADASVQRSSLSKEGIHRRNAFLQGNKTSVSRSRDVDEPQEAEMLPKLDSRKDQMAAAMKYLSGPGQASQTDGEASTHKTMSFSRSFAFGDKSGGLASTHDVSKQGASVPASASKMATLRADSVSQNAAAVKSTNLAFGASSEHSDRVDGTLPLGLREAGHASDRLRAAVGEQDVDESFEITLDILSVKGTQATTSQLASEVTDLAALWRKELHAARSSQVQVLNNVLSAVQEGSVHTQRQVHATDDAEVRATPDLQFILDRARTHEWKDDGLVQERAGLWALHVAAARTGMSPEALRAGFKQKAIQALGRLALQLLSTTGAKQLNTVVSSKQGLQQRTTRGMSVGTRVASSHKGETSTKQEVEAQQRNADAPPTSQRVAVAVQDVDAFFHKDATQMDLQTIQSGMDLDTTADEVFDAFVETLRNDGLDMDAAPSRLDACHGVEQAAESHDIRFRTRPSESRRSTADAQLVQTRAASQHTVRFRDDVDGVVKADAAEHRHARAMAPVQLGRMRNSFSKAPAHTIAWGAEESHADAHKTERVE